MCRQFAQVGRLDSKELGRLALGFELTYHPRNVVFFESISGRLPLVFVIEQPFAGPIEDICAIPVLCIDNRPLLQL